MLTPVSRRSLSDAVFEQLRGEIVRGALPAGAPLPAERARCESLGVNRGAVREGLRKLEQARLVSVRHGGTSRVLDFRESAGLDLLGTLLVRADGSLDADAIRGVMEVRGALAPEIARAAARRAGEAELRTLDAVVTAMRAATPDAARLQRLAIDYWSAVVEAAHNLAYRLLWNTLRETYERMLPLLTGVLAGENGDPEAFAALAAAVRARDEEAACTRARALVRLGERAVADALRALADAHGEVRR